MHPKTVPVSFSAWIRYEDHFSVHNYPSPEVGMPFPALLTVVLDDRKVSDGGGHPACYHGRGEPSLGVGVVAPAASCDGPAVKVAQAAGVGGTRNRGERRRSRLNDLDP